jgi:hypothetical protein
MIVSFVLGVVLVFMAGMDLQRILIEGAATPSYVRWGFVIVSITGLVNLIAAVGAARG